MDLSAVQPQHASPHAPSHTRILTHSHSHPLTPPHTPARRSLLPIMATLSLPSPSASPAACKHAAAAIRVQPPMHVKQDAAVLPLTGTAGTPFPALGGREGGRDCQREWVLGRAWGASAGARKSTAATA